MMNNDMNVWSMVIGGLIILFLGFLIIKLKNNNINEYKNKLKCEMIAKNECVYNEDWKMRLKCEKKVFDKCMKIIK